MADNLQDLINTRAPTAERPLLGLTVLVVEDSRFASEAMRLLCLRSGARIRRADSLRSARRHLAVYRPTVVIIDVGLPDGSGTELIAELVAGSPRVTAILAMSGDPDAEQSAKDAGADGFLGKPIESLSAFQAELVSHLPNAARPHGLRLVAEDGIDPDPLALLDDLTHVSDLLTSSDNLDRRAVSYAVQFLSGLARIAHDPPLQEMATRLSSHYASGEPIVSDVANIAGLVQERLIDRKIV